jgi:hypothetical protein
MSVPQRIEGYAIVSEEGMLANAAGIMRTHSSSRPINTFSNTGSMRSTSWFMGATLTSGSRIRICVAD